MAAKPTEQAVEVLPQLMPTGELVMRPLPVPPVDTRIVNGPTEVNVAIVTCEVFRLKPHVLVADPAHGPPVQPVNVDVPS